MGNKLEAREAVAGWGVPIVPGSKTIRTAAEAEQAGNELGYPLMIKAAAGGGGRGIKVIDGVSQVEAAVMTASAEAKAAFGDDTLFAELYIADARHIEVQVLGDASGKVVHVGERDCSLQRRYQKVVEEAPAAGLSDAMIGEIRDAAVTIATKTGYRTAGTVEFIVDQATSRFYFLEMNTRIQVEHPVTEMVSGLDLVREQIRIAGGQGLSAAQPEIAITGHAIECRITAEAPEHDFRPSPGRITAWRPPEMDNVRIDSHCHEGAVITPYYDSLLAKLIVHGPNRIATIARMQAALDGFQVEGIDTNLGFLRRLSRELDYLKGGVNTRWLEANLGYLATS
jgi:acetyl-CoA carboxylase biotin carboxylase subunit